MDQLDIVREILTLARWAPSGDNTQPWRFEIVTPLHVVIHGFDTRDHCVYDLDGHPSQISLGALIETASIAASGFGQALQASRRADMPETKPTFDLHFQPRPEVGRDPLIDVIETRSVQRRPFTTRPLTAAQRSALEQAAGPDHSVSWKESFSDRLATARLMFRSAKLRLTMPEAYLVHREIIEWGAKNSVDRVPDQALGVDAATIALMRFVMKDWSRVSFFNRFLAGTVAPRVQMDFLPAIFCAAHFALRARTEPRTIDDYVAAGRKVQRFWLTATQLGLQLQPEVTPLVFSRYARERREFSATQGMSEAARDINNRLSALVGEDAAKHTVFFGRVGTGRAATARSIRRPFEELLIP